jgi:uncharacterized membrane protein YedE/YeeE
MLQVYEFIIQPWPWFVSGPAIAIVMFFLLWFGNSFGLSSNFRTICSISGAGKNCDFFDFNWRKQLWNLVFVFGGVIGGFIGHYWLSSEPSAHISETTKQELSDMGIQNPGEEFLPTDIFNLESLMTVRGFVMIIIGGFLVGFGTRYAGGCTSGHAISGLSNFQLPSLIAVIGFFIGGLLTTYFIIPILFQL